jgi:ribonucleoside-diphosphate reductase alpha chain
MELMMSHERVTLPPPALVVRRRRLPDDRYGITRRFAVRAPGADLLKIYVIVGCYVDGTPGEIFIHADKAGSLASGAFDAFAVSMSLGLQYGVPIEHYARKMRGMRFEPMGMTDAEEPELRMCSSVLDLVGRWLLFTFCAPTPDESSRPL